MALSAETKALVRLDPKKSEWARLDALIDHYIGDLRMGQGQLGEARGALNQAVDHLDALYQRNTSDQRSASDLARSLLVRADLAAKNGDRAAMLADCGRAAGLIPAAARVSADHRMLDPWVRSQFCLGNSEVAADAKAKLARIGYQEPSYLRYMAKHNQRIE